ncbi:ABC transporter permease [Paenibacillus rhizovicinus]|uniref:Transport permease protein n=1 Tax=Paenibacillus rhizovicinus TaxID=2704463 RepID=A0A6C0NZ70_9BACL|nr:ABC transporter permease [Paenibacillus rhizovicinus]QHW31550.1 ABC transporter permease [Paenibacillus rhizovicinus]
MVTGFIKDFLTNQRFIMELAKKDFKTRYLGSFLGVVWGFIQPTIQVLIFWFVFQVGFKNMPVDNFPFILWLASAMIPWFFISDSIAYGTNAIIENSYLVKKVVFRVSVLPIVKIYSALFVHIFFILFLILMFLIYGYNPTLYYLQILYYLPCILLFTLGVTWITSSLNIFLKDIGQLVGMFIQFGFWLVPIFYSLDTVPDKFHFIMKLNPAYYLVEGYRDTFIYHVWFWEHPMLTLNFWLSTFVLLGVGTIVFKKLRPHFADVL